MRRVPGRRGYIVMADIFTWLDSTADILTWWLVIDVFITTTGNVKFVTDAELNSSVSVHKCKLAYVAFRDTVSALGVYIRVFDDRMNVIIVT